MNSTLTQKPSIHCRWIKGAFVTDLSACTYSEKIAVFSVRISEFRDQVSTLRNVLNGDELLKSVNYVMERDSNRFIISRAVLRILLGRFTGKQARDIEFSTIENLKPCIQSGLKDVHFNVTHSGDLILIAISKKPVGIDTEFLDEDFAYNRIAEISFSEEEMTYINQSHNPAETFFLLWTRKEALLKGTGKGIDERLPLVPVLDGTHRIQQEIIYSSDSWTIGSFGIGHEYVASLAHHPGVETERLSIFRVDSSIFSI